MQGKRWRGGHDVRETWGDAMGIRRSEGGVMSRKWRKVRRKIMKRGLIFFVFFLGTGENINQSVWIVIGQCRVESMRGYQEVKFGRRWKTKVVAEVC